MGSPDFYELRGIEEAVKKPPEEALSGWSWIPLDGNQKGNNLSSVYFCLRNCLDSPRSDAGRNQWYKIDFKEEEDCVPTLTPTDLVCALDKMPSGAPTYSSSVAIGSRIYVIGGRTYPWLEFDNDVFYFDTNLPDQGWRKGPQMLAGRCGISPVAIDGKIYVFGGSNKWHIPTTPYAEVLDLDLGLWVALPSPPPHLQKSHFVVPPVKALLLDARGHKHVVFNSLAHRALYSYDIDAGTWSPFDSHFSYFWSDLVAAVDGVLYCYDRGYVYGYNILNRRRFSQPVGGLEHVLPARVGPLDLLHIGGGKLFLFWTIAEYFKRPGNLTIHCAVFTVDKSSVPGDDFDEPVLSAHVHSVSRLVAHGEDCILSSFAFTF